jgi:hypothetical protein
MFSLAQGALAVSGEAALIAAAATGAALVAPIVAKLKNKNTPKVDDEDELKQAIRDFVEDPSRITLHDLHYAANTFRSSNYKPPVFDRTLIANILIDHPDLLKEL